MEKTAHTPTPWFVEKLANDLRIWATNGNMVISPNLGLLGSHGEANADYIVNAVNCHAKLLEALKGIESAVNKAYSVEHGQACLDFVNEVARAAIAEAEGAK